MPEAHNNMGTLLLGIGELENAIGCFQRAIAIENNYAQAIYNLGLSLNRMGRPAEAVEHARRCLAVQPDNGEALALLVSLLQQICDWKSLSSAGDHLDRLTDAQLRSGRRPSESPFLNFTRSTDPRKNLLIARAWSHWLQQEYAHRRPEWGFAKHHQRQSASRSPIFRNGFAMPQRLIWLPEFSGDTIGSALKYTPIHGGRMTAATTEKESKTAWTTSSRFNP